MFDFHPADDIVMRLNQQEHTQMTPKLKALAALWLTAHRIADSIEALEEERARVARASDELNADDEYTSEEIEEAVEAAAAQDRRIIAARHRRERAAGVALKRAAANERAELIAR